MEYMHYTINSSDAAFLYKRNDPLCPVINDWVNGWKPETMITDLLPMEVQVELGMMGMKVCHTKTETGWSFDIGTLDLKPFHPQTQPIYPMVANVLTSQYTPDVKGLFQLAKVFGSGENKLPITDIQFPALLTWVNTGLTQYYIEQVGREYTKDFWNNIAILEQVIALALIQKG